MGRLSTVHVLEIIETFIKVKGGNKYGKNFTCVRVWHVNKPACE